ncbi:hypothetical protein H6F45_21775, partial [Sphaerospermopsis sp. FACHB-1194]|nr:hypothetical protein [Sphaerospermopsis sp. FACHB-1194]
RSQESGVRSQESGVRSQESGVRSQESGVRSQESGVRSQEEKLELAIVYLGRKVVSIPQLKKYLQQIILFPFSN